MQTYQKKNRGAPLHDKPAPQTARASVPSMDALRSGQAQPTAEQLGQKVDLPGQIQAKMEHAFGMDFSGVQLYRSQAVADAGAQAVAQGSRIAFAPGQTDFTSRQGQELLGHELSHVASQTRGEVQGRGFLDNSALEARADHEGALAANGESAGPVTGSLSSVSAVGASGPMQAKKDKKKAAGTAPAPAQTTGEPELADEDDYDLLEDKVAGPLDAFNDGTDFITDSLDDLADDKEGPAALRQMAGRAKDSKGMKVLRKARTATGGIRAGIGFCQNYKGMKELIETGELDGDTVEKGAELASDFAGNVATSLQSVNEFLPESRKFLSEQTSDSLDGVTEMLGGGIQAFNSMRHLIEAAQDDAGEGDKVQQITDATSGVLEGGSSIVSGLENMNVLSEEVAGPAGALLQMGSGALNAGSGVRQTVMANTDRDLSKSTLAKIRNGSQGRTGEDQQKNDQLMDNLLSAQQRTAKVHRREGISKTVHGALDMAGGAAAFLPVIGTAASIGIGATQKVADYVGSEMTDREKKLMREGNLGDRHMQLRQRVTERLIQQKKCQKAAVLNKSPEEVELTIEEIDECQHRAKHAVNKRLYEGATTNKMANMKKTDQEQTSMEELMQEKNGGRFSDEAKLTAERFGAAGHAVRDGQLVDRKATMAKLNADMGASTDVDDAWDENIQKEERKYHIVAAAKAKADAEAKEEQSFKDRYGDNWKKELRKAKKKKKAKEKEKAEQEKATRADRRKASAEARNAAKQQLKAENAQKKQGDDGSAKKLSVTAAGTASSRANMRWDQRAKSWFQGKYLHWKRNHDRMRDSMVNDGWEDLSKWDRFKLAATNPLAYMASKTASGKAKSKARADQQAGWDAIANDELERVMAELDAPVQQQDAAEQTQPETPAAQSAPVQMPDPSLGIPLWEGGDDLIDQGADPSLLTVQQHIHRYNSGTASSQKVDPSVLTLRNKIRHFNRR